MQQQEKTMRKLHSLTAKSPFFAILLGLMLTPIEAIANWLGTSETSEANSNAKGNLGVMDEDDPSYKGQLNLTDANSAPLSYLPIEGQEGDKAYGQFSINANGEWVYELDTQHPDIQQMSKGQVIEDSLTVFPANSDPIELVIFITDQDDGISEEEEVAGEISGSRVKTIELYPAQELEIADINPAPAPLSSSEEEESTNQQTPPAETGDDSSEEAPAEPDPEPSVESFPVANDDEVKILAGNSIEIFALDNDLSPEAYDLIISNAEITDGKGALSVSSNSLIYDSGLAYANLYPESSETVTIEYDILDEEGGTDSAMIYVTVYGNEQLF